MFGCILYIVSRSMGAYSRGSMSLPLKDAHVREAGLCCNEGLVGALILPPNGRGGRTL